MYIYASKKVILQESSRGQLRQAIISVKGLKILNNSQSKPVPIVKQFRTLFRNVNHL